MQGGGEGGKGEGEVDQKCTPSSHTTQLDHQQASASDTTCPHPPLSSVPLHSPRLSTTTLPSPPIPSPRLSDHPLSSSTFPSPTHSRLPLAPTPPHSPPLRFLPPPVRAPVGVSRMRIAMGVDHHEHAARLPPHHLPSPPLPAQHTQDGCRVDALVVIVSPSLCQHNQPKSLNPTRRAG